MQGSVLVVDDDDDLALGVFVEVDAGLGREETNFLDEVHERQRGGEEDNS